MGPRDAPLGTFASRRLFRDLKRLQREKPEGVTGAPVDNNILRWHGIILGPHATSWDGGIFHLELFFTEDYPQKPPQVRFLNPVFHPNVYNDGNICLDILQSQWSPTYDIWGILISIRSLLTDPNPNSPANTEAARLFSENRGEYNRRVKQCVLDSLAFTEEDDVQKNGAAPSSCSAAPGAPDAPLVAAAAPVPERTSESGSIVAASTTVAASNPGPASQSATAPVDRMPAEGGDANSAVPTPAGAGAAGGGGQVFGISSPGESREGSAVAAVAPPPSEDGQGGGPDLSRRVAPTSTTSSSRAAAMASRVPVTDAGGSPGNANIETSSSGCAPPLFSEAPAAE